jgi:3-oxoacyl-[acyl-carrier-protein] synthase III
MNLHSVASYVPEGRIDNLAQGASFGETGDFIRGKIGAVELPVMAAGQQTSDLGCEAVSRLVSATGLNTSAIDALVLVTQNGDGQHLPHTSALMHAKLGLPKSTAVFDLSLGCSGFVYGLQVLKGFMQASGFGSAVLVTADPYSKIIDRTDRVTTLLFGDAATASLLRDDGAWELSRPAMGSDGTGAAAIMVTEGRLGMNGRQVFNFAATVVPDQIKSVLAAQMLHETDIDRFCLHQGSAAIIEAIARRFPAVRDRFVNKLAHTGNTVSSSIPLLLEHELADPTVRKILISGFGVGLSWATMVLSRKVAQ